MNQSQKILVKNLKEKGVSKIKISNWLESKEIEHSPYLRMQDFYNLIKKNEKIILKYISNSIYEKFMFNMNDLKNNNQKDKFCNTISQGGAIIFDESGIHKGTAPTLNDIISFRYIFKKKNEL